MLDTALDRLVEGLFIAASGGMHDALNIPRVCVWRVCRFENEVYSGLVVVVVHISYHVTKP